MGRVWRVVPLTELDLLDTLDAFLPDAKSVTLEVGTLYVTSDSVELRPSSKSVRHFLLFFLEWRLLLSFALLGSDGLFSCSGTHHRRFSHIISSVYLLAILA